MATKLYLLTTGGTHSIPSTSADDRWAAIGTPGSGVISTSTPTSASSSVYVASGGTLVDDAAVLSFWSPPVNAVTISGTITCNVWGFESSMSANEGFGITIWNTQNDGGGTWSSVSSGDKGVELGTASAVNNWTFTPSPAEFVSAGNRLLILIQLSGVALPAAGFTVTTRTDGPTGGADGDTWVQFTETITEQAAAAATLPDVGMGQRVT